MVPHGHRQLSAHDDASLKPDAVSPVGLRLPAEPPGPAPTLPKSTSHWRGVPARRLVWREWEGDFVVFNEETGSTHLLRSEAASILRRLGEVPDGIAAEALAEGLSGRPAGLSAVDRVSAIEDALRDFARLGLARPV